MQRGGGGAGGGRGIRRKKITAGNTAVMALPGGEKRGRKKGRIDETNEAQRQKSVNASGVTLLKRKMVER